MLSIQRGVWVSFVVFACWGCGAQPSSEEAETSAALGSLESWVDACELEAKDLNQLLENEVLLVDAGAITKNDDGTYALVHQTYTQNGVPPNTNVLCSDSRFYKQEQVAALPFRSAVQVGRDLVLTAWHSAATSTPAVVAIRGLRYRAVGDACLPPDFDHIPSDQVFSVTSVVADGFPTIGRDFLLLRVDRSMGEAFPRVRRSGQGQPGNRLTMIGHPDRLATKVDLEGVLDGWSGSGNDLSPRVRNLHALVGSSGGMVYDRDERFVETVTRFGVGAFVQQDDQVDCVRVVHSDQASETNVSIRQFAQYIPAFELLVDSLDTVVHVGPVGGPFTNPETAKSVSAAETASGNIEYLVTPPAAPGSDPDPEILLNVGAPLSGKLEPGKQFTIKEAISANEVPCGVYERTYAVSDVTHGFRDVVRHRFEIGVRELRVLPEGRVGIQDIAAPIEDTLSYTVTNVRPTATSVLVTSKQSWVKLNGAPSTTLALPPFGSVTVVASIDSNHGLPHGSHEASLRFEVAPGSSCPAMPAIDRNFTFTWGSETFADFAGAPIPDGSPLGLTRFVNVPETFCIGDLDVSVSATVVPAEQLLVRLTAPWGATRLLWNHGAHDNEPLRVTFDDEGFFPPLEPLSKLDGNSGSGLWRLDIVDDVPGIAGTLMRWGIRFDAGPCM